MERIKSALEKARLERERLQHKSQLRQKNGRANGQTNDQEDNQANNMDNTKLSEVDALRTQLLARAPFSHCTAEQQKALLRDGSFVELSTGETLQFAGEIDGYVHYLLSGSVAIESDNHPSKEISSDVLSEIVALDKAGLKTSTITATVNTDIFRIAQSCLPNFAQYAGDEPLPQALYTDTQSGKDLADLVQRLDTEKQSIEQSSVTEQPKVPLGENTLGFNFDINELSGRAGDLEQLQDAIADNTRAPITDDPITNDVAQYEPDVKDEIGEFARQLDGQFRHYVNKVRLEERTRYEEMMDGYAKKLKTAAEGKLREKVQLVRDRYDAAYARKEEKLLERVHKLREFANQITRQKAAIYEARRGLADKLAHAERLHNELNDLGDEVYTQLDRLDELMPDSDDVQSAVKDS